MNKENKVFKVAAIIGASVLLVGAGAMVGANAFPKEITKIEFKDKPVPFEDTTKIVALEGQVKTLNAKLAEKPLQVTETIYADNENLPTVLKYVEDNVDEDITMSYIQFEVDSKIDSEALITEKMVSLLDDNDFFDDGNVLENFRKSEVSIKKISDATIIDQDYKDKDLTLEYDVKIKAKEANEDSIYHTFKVTIPFESSKILEEDIEVELIE